MRTLEPPHMTEPFFRVLVVPVHTILSNMGKEEEKKVNKQKFENDCKSSVFIIKKKI